jgi:O-acetylserine/cysteine efflux transporter
MSETGAPRSRLGPASILALLLVSALWGFNFVVIAVGVKGVPPLFLAALRFVLAAFPALLFVRRPSASWGLVAAYGLVLGVGEFGFLFSAIKLGASAGLASLALQSQAFFTAVLAALFLGEAFRARQWIGMALSSSGLALMALTRYGASGAAMPPLAFAMILLAALSWAVANVLARRMGKNDALGLMVWSSLASPLPLLGLSLLFEGAPAMAASVRGMSLLSAGAIVYLAFVSTLLGYGIWNRAIARHGAATVAPFSLLVPVFGLGSSALFLGERFDASVLLASLLVFAGLVVHVLGGKKAKR